MKPIYAILGFIFLGIGITGIIIPGMPGTVFLLIALFCFGKSSERLHDWFLQTQIYQDHLKSYHETLRIKSQSEVAYFADFHHWNGYWFCDERGSLGTRDYCAFIIGSIRSFLLGYPNFRRNASS